MTLLLCGVCGPTQPGHGQSPPLRFWDSQSTGTACCLGMWVCWCQGPHFTLSFTPSTTPALANPEADVAPLPHPHPGHQHQVQPPASGPHPHHGTRGCHPDCEEVAAPASFVSWGGVPTGIHKSPNGKNTNTYAPGKGPSNLCCFQKLLQLADDEECWDRAVRLRDLGFAEDISHEPDPPDGVPSWELIAYISTLIPFGH